LKVFIFFSFFDFFVNLELTSSVGKEASGFHFHFCIFLVEKCVFGWQGNATDGDRQRGRKKQKTKIRNTQMLKSQMGKSRKGEGGRNSKIEKGPTPHPTTQPNPNNFSPV
jgi:hypothetical protein